MPDTMQSLHARTMELLAQDSRQLTDIARDSGLPYEWVTRFARGTWANPGVNRVQQLYEHLSRTELRVK